LKGQVEEAIARLESELGKQFGSVDNPLLLSVRSGARVLDARDDGHDPQPRHQRSSRRGDRRTHRQRPLRVDSYRRFIQMYGDVVMGVQTREGEHHEPFDQVMHELKGEVGIHEDINLTVDHLKELVKRFKALIKNRTGNEFPRMLGPNFGVPSVPSSVPG